MKGVIQSACLPAHPEWAFVVIVLGLVMPTCGLDRRIAYGFSHDIAAIDADCSVLLAGIHTLRLTLGASLF
jgi:hypothetical protein